MSMFLALLLKTMPSVLAWVMTLLATIYPDIFPAMSATGASVVTAGNSAVMFESKLAPRKK